MPILYRWVIVAAIFAGWMWYLTTYSVNDFVLIIMGATFFIAIGWAYGKPGYIQRILKGVRKDRDEPPKH